MIFLPEPAYLFPAKNEDARHALSTERFKDAIIVTVLTMSRWYPRYDAELLMPTTSAKAAPRREGVFSTDPLERAKEVHELCAWIFGSSIIPDVFTLFLRDEHETADGELAPFDHHDDTCCWALDLPPERFAELQDAWQAASLPTDLFYDAQQTIEIVTPPGTFVRFLNRFGCDIQKKRTYSPKQWALKKSSEQA